MTTATLTGEPALTRAVPRLAAFKIAAYLRSHRVVQPFLGLLVVIIVLYSTRAPAGQELPAYADSAAMLVPVLAWAARGLLDAEPDVQRLISMTAAGRPGREVAAGLLAAGAVAGTLAALAVAVPLGIGFAAFPGPATIVGGLALHLLSLVAGVALGALTSRPILRDPATSALALLGGYAGVLLLGLVPVPWLTVPVLGWIRAAGRPDFLTAGLPGPAAITVVWCALALLAYTRLRRTRP
ncbi:hypothetical protein Sru01_54860 [Sphaerisporangium rufum]|uniref:Uncharacterized protein n=1 Tax=Sphaerisporangium rufum TaxID=1381558 RepID=A0A919V284_9ACTN|nr:hypothetical protein [Sphaerisporangium rufum]GII80504.1 hypothetical protein Sru01_54860 [Sphaerisporangium rufum]